MTFLVYQRQSISQSSTPDGWAVWRDGVFQVSARRENPRRAFPRITMASVLLQAQPNDQDGTVLAFLFRGDGLENRVAKLNH